MSATSLSLLERAKASDERAWSRMQELYSPLILRWCRKAGLKTEDAADIAQEVFLAAFKGLATFTKEKAGDTFRGWLRVITRRKVSDWRAKQQKQVKAPGGSDAVAQLQQIPEVEPCIDEASADRDDRAMLVRKAVEMLLPEFPEWYAQVYHRVILAQEDPAEVASILGMNRGALYNAKSRMLRRLKEEFQDLFEV